MRVAVVGAGIVGVSTAEWLRRDGHDVTLFDRVEPGDPAQTSYGNAGMLARAAVVPVPGPGLLAKVPSMLLSPDGPLFLRWRHLPWLVPWLVPFLRSGRSDEVRRIAAALAGLLGDSVDQHKALARGTPAERFIVEGEYVYLYRDRAAFEKDAFGWGLRAEHGFDGEERDRERLLEEDPNLGPAYGFGFAQPDHGWITAPGRYVRALFEHFTRNGGAFRQAEVDDIVPAEDEVRVTAGGETRAFDRAVLAAGAWSGRLARRLGHRPALESERGYHLMLRGTDFRPPTPYMIASRKFVVTPMEDGIRCAGLAEFAGLEAAPSDAPVELLRRQIRVLYPDLEWEEEESWLGHRPSTIDSLPLIGESPKARGVYFAFGAQHVGLTSGPKTGRLIADMVAGRRANIDLSAFRVGRFDR